MDQKKIKIKPAHGLKIPKLFTRGFYVEGEEVIETKEILRYLRSGDLEIMEPETRTKRKFKSKTKQK